MSVHARTAVHTLVSRVRVTFVTHEGERYEVWARVGDSLLDTVVDKDIPLDGYGRTGGGGARKCVHRRM